VTDEVGETRVAMQPFLEETGWAPLRFLLGYWVGEGGGASDQGSGWFTFTTEVQGQLMVSRNHAEYPADADRPAVVHDDLMIIYRDPAGAGVRAVYFDNEGHAIHYSVAVVEPTGAIQFDSAGSAAQPGYRLTYIPTSPDTLRLTFEIAPPAPSPTFTTYIEARARRGSGAG
jgi:hypothetical protein